MYKNKYIFCIWKMVEEPKVLIKTNISDAEMNIFLRPEKS